MSEVVITGAGSVGPYGAGRQALAEALRRGEPLQAEIDRAAGLHRDGSARTAGLADLACTSGWLSARTSRRMSRPSRFAVAAARMAWEDAGLDREAPRGPTSVALATAFGPISITEQMLQDMREHGAESASPFHFTECVANAPAAQVALALGARGSNTTNTQREAGPLRAVARGWRDVASGRSRRAVVGSVDEVTPLLHAVLDRYAALARPDAAGKDELPRPFDRRRDGCLLAEGAAAWILEREEDARLRGATIFARVSGAGGINDPSAPAADWGRDGALVAAGLGRFLRRTGTSSDSVDRILSGASGSRQGDRLEAAMLRGIWPESMPTVLAPKGVVGEYGGGFLAAALVAMSGGAFGRLVGFEEPDPELRVTPHGGGDLAPARTMLISSQSAGGAGAWVLLEAA